MFSNLLKFKVFFKLSEKQLVVLLKQPIVLYLGVFERFLKMFWMVDLLSNQKQPIDSLFQPIVCLKS